MKKLLALLLAFALCALAHAEPIKLTNRQIDELYAAHFKIGPGLSAANTTIVARNSNVLRPLAEAYAKGLEASRVNNHITAATKNDSPEAAKAGAEMQKLAFEVITVDLARFLITPEELDRMTRLAPPESLRFTAQDQATLLFYLEPKSK